MSPIRLFTGVTLAFAFATLPARAATPSGQFLTPDPLTSPAVVQGRFFDAGRLTSIYVRIVGYAYAKEIRLGPQGRWSFTTGKLKQNGRTIRPTYIVTGFRGKTPVVKVTRTYTLLPALAR